jgi:hypothetical protein
MALVGVRFERLTVLGIVLKTEGKKEKLYECRCDCGNTTRTRATHLRSGAVKSCGCYSRDIAKIPKPIQDDLTGKKFGRLTVVRVARRGGSGRGIIWFCQCDCGNTSEVPGIGLRGPHGTRSCGCLNSERFARMARSRRAKDPWATEAHHYHFGATKRNLSWGLSTVDFRSMVLAPCHYCGAPPNQLCGAAELKETGVLRQGIDRVDSTKGYTPGNCVPCCWTCNCAKGKLTYQEFIETTRSRYEHMTRNGLVPSPSGTR